jgi:hypothetical protein
MTHLTNIILILSALILFPPLSSRVAAGEIRKDKTEGTLCISVPVIITSRVSEFMQRDKDTLSRIIAECVKARLDKAGFSWIQAPEELDDRIMRNFKPKLIDHHEPVDSISFAAADLAQAQKVKYLAVVYMYLDSDHSGAMRVSGIFGSLGGGGLLANAIADQDDDLYVFCSCYNVLSRKSTMSKSISISSDGKSRASYFKEEVQKFVNAVFK